MVRNYFHFYPKKIQRRTGKILIFSAVFCAEICIAAFFVLIFSLVTARNSDVIVEMLLIICGIILFGMGFCFFVSESAYKKIRRNSRYTYVDIQKKAVIYSAYGGEYRMNGELIITRALYYIPFEALKSIEKDKNGRFVALSGKIRYYALDSRNLGYHIKDGDVEFDREWLNIGGYEEIQTTRIPAVFGKCDRLYESLKSAYEGYLAEPKPKPYVFREADFIRRRAKPRVMPEEFGYSRKW